MLHICESPIFSATMAVMHHCRQPLMHFYNFMGAESANGGTEFHELVCGRSDDFISEFAVLLDDDEFWTRIACTEGLEQEQVESLRDLACNLVAVYVAAFKRRVCDVVSGFPWRWLIAVKSPVDVVCNERNAV